MGIFGLDTDSNVAYQGFALLLVMLAIALCFGWFFAAHFSVARLLPQFGTAGSPLTYTIRATNLGTSPQKGLLLREVLADPRPSFPDWLAMRLADEKHSRSFRVSESRRTNPFRMAKLKEIAMPAAPPGHELSLKGELLPLRRGVLRLTQVTIARSDPFGLFRALANVSLPQTVMILPKRYPLPTIALPGTMKYQEGGVAFASSVGQSDEFVSLRDYRQGDPLRHIHWRSWAKAGKPVVKEFEDEFFVRHALVLDTFIEHPHSDAFEEAVSLAASFACTIPAQESLLDLLFVGVKSFCFTAGRGLAHADQMLEILASVRACQEHSFQALEHLVLDHIEAVSGCVCILLEWDEPRKIFVQKLRKLGVPLLVFVVVERGGKKELEPGPMQEEPERFRVLEVGKIPEGLVGLK